MSYLEKYLKYKHKYQNLLQQAGATPEISISEEYVPRRLFKPNPILYVNLIRVLSNDNQKNKYMDQYQTLITNKKLIDYRKLKQIILLFDKTKDTWKDLYSWEIIFRNTIPIYNSKINMTSEQKSELASNPYHMLFDSHFKFFQKIIKSTYDSHYMSIKNPDQWVGINDASDLQNKVLKLKITGSDASIDNCYGLKKEISDDSEVCIIGDIHSSFHSLFEIIQNIKSNFFVGNSMELKKNRYIVFTGDITDYGPYSLEVLWFVLTLYHYNQENVIILKGNHENYHVYSDNGRPNLSLINEIFHQFEIDADDLINEVGLKIEPIIKTLSILPTVLFLKFRDQTYQLNHGSINLNLAGYDKLSNNFSILFSPLLYFLEDDRKKYIYISNDLNDGFKWGDFYYNPNDLTLNKVPFRSNRQKHPHNVVQKYLETHNIAGIISGHQDTTSLGILPVDQKKKTFRVPGGMEYLEWKASDGLIVTPDQDQSTSKLSRDRYLIPIKVGIDALAVTLSTAVPYKKVKFTNYGILK